MSRARRRWQVAIACAFSIAATIASAFVLTKALVWASPVFGESPDGTLARVIRTLFDSQPEILSFVIFFGTSAVCGTLAYISGEWLLAARPARCGACGAHLSARDSNICVDCGNRVPANELGKRREFRFFARCMLPVLFALGTHTIVQGSVVAVYGIKFGGLPEDAMEAFSPYKGAGSWYDINHDFFNTTSPWIVELPVFLSFWLPMAITICIVSYYVSPRVVSSPTGRCQNCDYSLHGLKSANCPECGYVIREMELRENYTPQNISPAEHNPHQP